MYTEYEANPTPLLEKIKTHLDATQIYSSNYLKTKDINTFKASKKLYKKLLIHSKTGIPILRDDLYKLHSDIYKIPIAISCPNCFILPYKGEKPHFNIDPLLTHESTCYTFTKHLKTILGTTIHYLRKFKLIDRDTKCPLCNYLYAGTGGNYIALHRLEHINHIMGLHDKIITDSNTKNTNISLPSIARKLQNKYDIQIPSKALNTIISLHIDHRGYTDPPANLQPDINHTINECP